jgi:hypothetical protein
MHISKMFWDTIRYEETQKDHSKGAREDMGDMKRYWDITDGVRDIMGCKERGLDMTGFLGLIKRRTDM